MKKLLGKALAAAVLCMTAQVSNAGDSAVTTIKPLVKSTATASEQPQSSTTPSKELMETGYPGRDKTFSAKSGEPKKLFGPGVTKTDNPMQTIGIQSWRIWTVMIIMLLMLAGMFYVLKRFGRGILPNSDAQILNVKAKIQLDARNSVAILRIYDEEYVVGTGANGVNLLTKLLPIDGVESELEEPPQEGAIDEKKVKAEFEKEFGKMVDTGIESEEIK